MYKMTKLSICALLMLLIGIFHGCTNKPETSHNNTINPNLEERLKTLDEEVKNLKKEIENLKEDVESKYAVISTEEKVLGIAKTKEGSFAIVCKNVTPYLDGYKINLAVGNLTAGSFEGFELHVFWGIPNTKDYKEKNFVLTNKLIPAEYTSIEVILTPAKPEEVKYIQVGIKLNQIILKNFR